jgi:hypothetical protein
VAAVNGCSTEIVSCWIGGWYCRVDGGVKLVYDKATIWFIYAVWLALIWLIAIATSSGMVAVCTPVMVLPVVNAATFVVAVFIVLVSSSSANMLYI